MMETKNKALLLFDGDCGLCSYAVRLILRFEKSNHLMFASLQSEYAKMLLQSFEMKEGNLDSVVLIENNQIYIKSKALIRVTRYLKFPLKGCVIFKVFPTIMLDWVYDLIAKNRHRLFKRKCLVIEDAMSDRFVK